MMEMLTKRPLDWRNVQGEGKDRIPDFIKSAPRHMYLETSEGTTMLGMRYFLLSLLVSVFSVGEAAVVDVAAGFVRGGGRAASNGSNGIKETLRSESSYSSKIG